MSNFQPSLGQMVFGNRWGDHELSLIGHAAFFYLMDQIAMAVWNRDQQEWERREDPEIEGVTWRPHWWDDCNCKDATCRACLPNFECCGVALRWYKYPMRGMSADRQISPDEWARWLGEALEVVRKADPVNGGGKA